MSENSKRISSWCKTYNKSRLEGCSDDCNGGVNSSIDSRGSVSDNAISGSNNVFRSAEDELGGRSSDGSDEFLDDGNEFADLSIDGGSGVIDDDS